MREQREDTIAALATAPGTGAVAIVRLSGPKARAIGQALTGVDARPRYAELCTFRGAGGEALEASSSIFRRRAHIPARMSSSCTAMAAAS